MGKVLSGLWANTVWAFLGLLLALSGLGNLIDPEKFAPMIVLDHVWTILIQFYGGMNLAGGVLIVFGAVSRLRTVEAAGWFLIFPSLLLAFAVFVYTGTWNRISVDIIYASFVLVILSRMIQLRREYYEIKLAQDLLAKIRARKI